jgi:hypothetical protein
MVCALQTQVNRNLGDDIAGWVLHDPPHAMCRSILVQFWGLTCALSGLLRYRGQ